MITEHDCYYFPLVGKKARPSLDKNFICKEINFQEMCKTKFGSVKICGRCSAFGQPCFYVISVLVEEGR